MRNIRFAQHQDGPFLISRDQDYQGSVAAPNGHKLTPIAVIESSYIAQILGERINGLAIDESQRLCFFIYYDPADYWLDYVSYHGSREELDFIKEGYVQAEFFARAELDLNKQSFCSVQLDEGTAGMSFLGGTPKYLQEEDYSDLSEYFFIGQVQGLDLPEQLADLFYLHGSVGYFFIKKDLTGGLFFVQSS